MTQQQAKTPPLRLACLLAACLCGVAGGAAAQGIDPLACAKTELGEPIRIGSPVFDVSGVQIGSVSISQCSADSKAATLRVWLVRTLGGEMKVFRLAGVTVKPDGVHLPLTLEQITATPTARPLVG